MLNPLAAIAIGSMTKKLPAAPKVVEMGNQRFDGYHARETLQRILGRPVVMSKGLSTINFYLDVLDFSGYLALDVNENKGARIVDLNQPLPDWTRGLLFDLVTNNGTSEHVWNQDQVFRNIHQLCKIDGVMLHIVPMTPWLNHGFFNYTPIVFRDLVAANGYQWEYLTLGNRHGQRVDIDPTEEWIFREKRPHELVALTQDIAGDILICAGFRKKTAEPFKMPFQGKYRADIQDKTLKEAYT